MRAYERSFGEEWCTFEQNELLNEPNPPVTVYFSTALLNPAHRLHQGVRFASGAELISQTLVAFLHAVRFSLRVFRAEDPWAYAMHSIRSRRDMGESLGRITYVPTGVRAVVDARGFLILLLQKKL